VTRTKATKSKALKAEPRKATEREREAYRQAEARVGTFPVRPELAVKPTETSTRVDIGAAHDAPNHAAAIYATFASRSTGFNNTLVNLLVNGARSVGETITSDQLNAGFAFVAALDPANEVEAVLAVHAYNCHVAAMDMLAKARSAQHPEGLNGFGNLATKLSRTFTMQIEALTKLKRGGEQVVRHVHVHEGAQAIVAEEFHHHSGGSKIGSADQSYAASDIGGRAALPCPDALGPPLPGARGKRQKAMSDARRDQSGGPEGE